MSRAARTLDISGYVEVDRNVLSGRRNAFYAELHGTKLYYWADKPRTADGPAPLAMFNIEGVVVEESPTSKRALLLRGPHLAAPVTLTFPADREKGEWMAKLKAPVAAHTKDMEVQRPAEEKPTGGVVDAVHTEHKVCLDDFDIIQVLGEGAFGCVVEVVKKDDGRRYAMKMQDKAKIGEAAAAEYLRERSILKELKHPFIVRLRYAFQTPEFLCIVMDLLAGGELYFHLDRCQNFTEERARFYIAEVGLAIGYIQSREIIYRDLKPENVVLDSEGHACLTDFGLAKAGITSATTNTFCGTPEYQAPEFLLGNPHGRAVDWWSLGVMLYEMIFGAPPFYNENIHKMSELIIEGELTFDMNGVSCSPAAEDLIRRLLDRDASTRMQTIEEFKAHPFFDGLDFDALLARKIPVPFVPDADTKENFSSDFTSAPVPFPETHTGKTHPNIAGFTYEASDDLPPAPSAATRAPPAQKAPSAKHGSTKSDSSNRGSPTAPCPPASSGKKSFVSASSSNGSSSTTKASTPSPTSKKAPAPHLVPKVPPRRAS